MPRRSIVSRNALLPDELSLHLQYRRKIGRFGNFRNPRTFTEHIQHRKLFEEDPRFALLTDKIEAKAWVAGLLGDAWIVPTLWQGDRLPAGGLDLPRPYVLKAAHGSAWTHFVFEDSVEDLDALRGKTDRWLASSFGRYRRERHYAKIPRRLIAEPFIGRGRSAPTDYKFMMFGGEIGFIHIDFDRFAGHKRVCLDRDWKRLPFTVGPFAGPAPGQDWPSEPPASLPRMIEAARALSKTFSFVRVDFYEVDGRPLFGEMTFTPGAGFSAYAPDEYDLVFGRQWAMAKQRLAETPAGRGLPMPAAKSPAAVSDGR
jgi:hypothetical protein